MNADSSTLPPHWHATIQTIKRELEAIEGRAVDKAAGAKIIPEPGAVYERSEPVVSGEDRFMCRLVRGKRRVFFCAFSLTLLTAPFSTAITLIVVLAGFLVLRSSAPHGAAADTITLLRFSFNSLYDRQHDN